MVTTTTGLATSFITFTRTSNATVTDSNGFIKWAGHNLLTNSESFDASAWAKSAATVSANATIAPNGSTNADTVLDTAVSNIHYISQSLTSFSPSGLTLTVSAFCKAATLNYATIGVSDISSGSLYAVAVFNLSSGSIATSGALGIGYSVVGTPTIAAVGSGWYLCSVTVTVGSSASFLNAVIGVNKTGVITASAGGFESYLGNGSGIHVWGAHVFRSDLGGMVLNPARGDAYYPTTPRNLLGFTEAFSDAAWVKTNILAFGSGSVANAVVAPNGLQTADLIVPNTTSGAHSASQAITSAVSGTTYIASIYVKPFGYAKFGIRENAATGAYATFNLSGAGSVIAQGSGGTGAITALSDGWYRVSMSSAAGSTSFQSTFFVLDSAYSSGAPFGYNWSGDGTSGIYFWGAQLSDSASLDAYSPVYGAAVTSAAYYAPRLDYDANGSALGLLVEEQRTNVVLLNSMSSVTGTAGSEYPNATGWANGNSTGGTRTYPSSSQITGYKALDISGVTSARNWIDYSFSAASSTTYTVSFWIESLSGVTGSIAYATGTLGTGGTSQIISAPTATGRVSYTFTTGTSAGTVSLRFGIGAAQNESGSIRISGIQCEIGASNAAATFPTSLIPTGASTATRTADVASVSTQAFPYSSTASSIVVSWTAGNVISLGNTLFYFDDVDGTQYQNIIAARQSNGVTPTAGVKVTVRNNSVDQAILDTTTPTLVAGTSYKMSAAFAANDFAACANAGTVVTDPSGTIPAGLDLLRIAGHRDGTYLNGHIRQITYIPRRLSNAELQARTL